MNEKLQVIKAKTWDIIQKYDWDPSDEFKQELFEALKNIVE